MRNEHSHGRWNNSDRYNVFDEKKNTTGIILSFTSTYTWHSGHAINIHWALDFLIRTFRFIFLSICTHLCFFFVLVDFNSNSKNKTTPFSHHHLFSSNSFLNYSKSDRRTSSPIEHHHHQDNGDEEEAEEDIELTTDENDDELDEDSCNR